MNQYEVLKVSRDAPQDVVTTAYHSLEKIYHTDVNSGSGDGTRTLQRINAAYEVLRDPKLRGQYDETLRTGEEIDPRLTKEPDGETHIPPHIHETIERELSNGLLPESAIAQLADTGYFIDAAAAAVVDVQQKLQNRFTAVRFVKSNRFWILLSGFLLMSGCGSPDPPDVFPPGVLFPRVLFEGRNVIQEDWYLSLPFELEKNEEVRMSVTLESGPSIDIYAVDEKSFNIWTTVVKKGQSVRGGWSFYPDLSHKGLPGTWTSPWCKLPAGKYVILIENTDFGDTAPPMNGVEDSAAVLYKLEVR